MEFSFLSRLNLMDKAKACKEITWERNINAWRAISIDSACPVNSGSKKCLNRGWYLFTVQMAAEPEPFPVKLSVNYGGGFSEEITYFFGLKNGDIRSRLIYLNEAPEEIRIRRDDSGVTFQLESLKVKKIIKAAAIHRMLYKILGRSRWKKSKFGRDYKNKIRQVAAILDMNWEQLLYERYNKKFLPTDAVTYKEWIEYSEKPHLIKLRKEFERKKLQGAKISIILPVYNTPYNYLRECIESVLSQWYENWELCISDDCSTKPHIKQILEEYASRDKRIKVIWRNITGHISEASNSALDMANGEYVTFLDHDDTLSPHALFVAANAIASRPTIKIIYSDEDKIDEVGNRSSPHFKPDWNFELLKGVNYVSHLTIYARELVEKQGGLRPGLEGSQDFDLLLRCQENVKVEEIMHLPDILYHWRMAEGSTAVDTLNKKYAHVAGLKALNEYLHSQGRKDNACDGPSDTMYRVKRILPGGKDIPLVSIIVPTRNALKLVRACIESVLEKTDYPKYEVLIVDNGSDDNDVIQWLRHIEKNEKIEVIKYDRPFNFSAICNYAASHARGEIICLLNNDIVVESYSWLTEMVSYAIDQEYGCIGAKLYYPDGKIQHGGVVLGIGGTAGHAHKYFDQQSLGYYGRLALPQSLSAVTGACLLVRKEVYEEVGGLDEENFPVAFNDIDFCLKVKKMGYKNIWTPYAELVHYESATRGYEDTPDKKRRFDRETKKFITKWKKDYLDNDEAYNPHLTRKREDFSIRLGGFDNFEF